MKAVVGLGNPGPRYAHTRHNVGFWVVDDLASGSIWQNEATYLWSSVSGRDDLLPVKPITYMNSSGIALSHMMTRFGIDLQDVLVIVDDIHLAVGSLRFRRRGSHGGHNGLRSIVEELGSSDFPRLRLGIGQPAENEALIEHVLGDFTTDERTQVDVGRASSAVLCWADQGIETAMNAFN
ncbi:MAG: aminoacyl-tRNA hydrolase [bacterium]|nr:aminoacyl-tRNA hydrolase [bacterium]